MRGQPDGRRRRKENPHRVKLARILIPELADLVEDPLHSDVRADSTGSPRDRTIATIAEIVALYRQVASARGRKPVAVTESQW